MSATENDPDLLRLGQDHKELRSVMSNLATDLARMEGKIDTQTTLMERFSERQDRSENRVDNLEERFREETLRLSNKHSALERDMSEKHNALSQKVWMGIGGIGLITLAPALFLLFKLFTAATAGVQ